MLWTELTPGDIVIAKRGSAYCLLQFCPLLGNREHNVVWLDLDEGRMINDWIRPFDVINEDDWLVMRKNA